jgi:type I restriction enzyme S subunit
MWPAGTLCITIVGANIAKTGILTFDACFPDSVVGFTPKEPFDAEYVRIWLRFLERALVARAPESARKNLNLAILRALPIPVPPLRKRQMFSERIDKLNQLIIYQKSSLEKLDMLFASIQSRAFLGKA